MPPRLVLEGLVQASQRSQDPNVVAEIVRSFLRRQICASHAGPERVIDALVLGPEVDAGLRQLQSVEQNPANVRASDEVSQAFLRNARDALAARAGTRTVIMTTADTRRTARRLTRQAGLDVPILSYADIAAEYQVRTVGVISADRRAAA
jgi:type III secretion protein V